MKTAEAKILREGITLLPRGDRGMVLTLLQRHEHNTVQRRYLEDMLNIVKAGPTLEVPYYPPGAYGRLVWHFQQAKRYISYPRIIVRQTVLMEDVVFSMAGNGAKQPGTVAINNGGSFGKSKHFGRLTLEGDLDLSGSAPSGNKEWDNAFSQMLFGMNANLSVFAQARYIFTGRCVFTDEPLDSAPSTTVGYDRITALRWQLPYPSKT